MSAPSLVARTPARLAAVAAAGALVASALVAVATQEAAHAAVSPYTWGNVEIVGGGFVPGIVYNQSEKGLVYARTDIGGAYRLDQTTKRWVPLLDHVGWDDWGHNGVLSLATDPVNPNKVFAAVGTYTNGWDPNNGAILRSSDRGATWAKTTLPFKVGGNMPGRGMGERLQVDPNDNRVLYFGTEGGNGLWRSTDSGVTWGKVSSFTNVGNYAQDPSDPNGYLTTNQGVVWVTFDPTSGTKGSPTRTIYVGVADKENTVYRSTDAGATWTRIAGQPTGYIAHKGVFDAVGKQLYIATSDTGGPYDGGHGDLWRLDAATGVWTQISPVPSSSTDNYFGYSGLTIDRKDPDTILAVTQISWFPDIQVFRSTDRGATWSRIWDWNGYPDRTLRYTQDISASGWLTFGKQSAPPETSPKLGWMTESFEIDPFDSNSFLYGTGATIYGGSNLTAWDTGGKVAISVKAQGLEETAVLDLAAPPGATELVSGLGDIGGFVHTDITRAPSAYSAIAPFMGSVNGTDFAEKTPATMVRVGSGDAGSSHISVSTSSGSSWWAGQEPGGVTGGGNVAMSADGSRIVWSADGAGVHTSSTLGSSWTRSTGPATGARVESDRVNPSKFYAFSGGTFWTSTDGGATFTASAATGLPTAGNVRFAAVPGREGDVWLTGGTTTGTYGMWHSTNSGASFTKIAAVDQGDAIGFGKAAPGAGYPAIYTSSKISGVRGIFRSIDAGATWVRINDDQHQWGWTGSVVIGDPDVYGRVYVGTNGRGIIVGNLTGTDPTTSPTPTPTTPTPTATATATATPTATPTPTVTPTPTPTPTVQPGVCSVRYTTNDWNTGFTASVRITNGSSTAITGWRLGFTFPAGQQITNLWSGAYTQSGATVTVTNAAWNGSIAPGGSVELGFNGSHTGTNTKPAAFTVNGATCANG
ncbi:cellulose-binding domain-containing protein [Cellulomonas sp. Root137]|uniref:cellulose-binding domain-containing protein n=1 Tax=Cellulomonas sp. Root137 TaxID=1736459 RepID=UPI0006FFCE1B|nr:cellulose-binding domain-containing protein [Cellulomonas sp. Root137]KQY43997.1 xyloglucanase [Cellulomonas sp. Root137]